MHLVENENNLHKDETPKAQTIKCFFFFSSLEKHLRVKI